MNKPDTYYRPVSRHLESELRDTLRKLLGVYQDLQAAQRFLGA